MDGYLLVDKPAGWTSHDVVGKVRSTLRQAESSELKVQSLKKIPLAVSSQLPAPSPKVKVGHTGTLDPFATGLLIIVLGTYTKKAAEFSNLAKTYDAELILGATSTTADPDGEITQKSAMKPSKEHVKAVLSRFEGKMEQMPPIYSAKKIDGQRAYKLARAGKAVKLEPKEVEVYSIQLTAYSYPKLSFTVSVSSGTYIRSLAVDIGETLGTGAYLSSLRRTGVGSFSVGDAVSIDKISISDIIKE